MTSFTVTKDTWHGGCYEAAIVLGEVTDEDADQRLRSAIIAVWSQAMITPKVDRSLSADLSVSDPKIVDLENLSSTLGVISHPSLGDIPCSTYFVREEGENPSYDWLYIGIPWGGLSDIFPSIGGWPMSDRVGSRQWREPIENMLSEIVMGVSKSVEIITAAIGYEIAGMIPDQILQGTCKDSELEGYLVKKDVDYKYFPTRNWD